jgi:hypothetical protein
MLLLLGSNATAADVSVNVQHDHLRGRGAGVLVAAEAGLSFAETGEKGAKHSWMLAWPDIQQLWVGSSEVRILTYADTWWKLGADREYKLQAAQGATFEPLYRELSDRLDQRLVGAISAASGDPLWQVPAKRRERFGGAEGVLSVGRYSIVFRSPEKDESRTWRLEDIDNVSSSGPFDLTLTTFERSKSDYGNRKSFNFQLKQPLSQSRFNALWRQLNHSKQLGFITSAQEKGRQ